MQFSKILPILFSEFKKNEIDFALVGGLALYFFGSPRTTFDADFMIFLRQAGSVDRLMTKLGYQCLYKTEDVANYVSKEPEWGQVDFLFAHRTYALSMLKRAEERELMGIKVKVLQPEDLIGLKIQSSTNDARRMVQDMADVESLIGRYHRTLDWKRVRDYFRIFNREPEFRDLQKKFQ